MLWKREAFVTQKRKINKKKKFVTKKSALKSLKKKDKSIRKALLRLLFSLLSPSLPIPGVILSSCNPFYINFASVQSLMLYVIYTLQMYIIRRCSVLLYTFFYCTFAALLGDGDFSWTVNSRGHFFSKWANSSGHFLRVNSRGYFWWILMDIFGHENSAFWVIVVITNGAYTVGHPTQGVNTVQCHVRGCKGKAPARTSKHCSVSGLG